MSLIITAGIDGPSEFTFRQIETNAENVRQAIRQTFFFMGRDLKKEISKAILSKEGKTGNVYNVRLKIKSGRNKGKPGRRIRHQSSAPGETHADLSGDLRKSLGWKVHGTDSLEIGYGITKTAPEYADIEFGNDRVAARPSIRNSIEGASFETFFEKALEKLEG